MLPEERSDLQVQIIDKATIMDILTRNTKHLIVRAKHCYSRKIVTNKRCDHCKKSMFLLALRCKDCRFKCHRKCAQNASPRCVLNLPAHVFRESSKPKQRTKPKTRAAQLAHHQAVPLTSAQDLSPFKRCHCPGGVCDTADLRRASDCDACRRLQSSSPPDSPKYTLGAPTRYSTVSPFQDRDQYHMGRSDITQEPPLTPTGLDAPEFGLRTSTPKRPANKSHQYYSQQDAPPSNVSSLSCGYYSCNSECSSDVFQTQDSFREDSACLFLGTSEYGRTLADLSRAERQRNWSKGERAKTVDVAVSRKCDTEMGKSLIATWPPHGHSNVQADATPESLADAQRICDSLVASRNTGVDHDIREAVKEWSIPHENLKYGMCLRAGRNGSTYRGNWHGEVLIHTRCHVEDEDAFLEEVSVLSMIRHENIALFMGACIDPPNLAIVTCVQKGPSLFQHLHSKQSKSPVNSRIHIARQIAQGMGYLHARGIVVGDLNTKAIFLESKVKVCLTGYDTTDGMCKREDYASVPQGHMTYIAPEILRTIWVEPPYLIEAAAHTMESDVYAFGTVLYELLTSQWPFASTFACTDSIIYRVCTGKRASLSDVKCVPSVKCLVDDCWSHNPNLRPTFQEIVEELNQNAALVNMKHSLSEPDLLNRSVRPW